MLPLVYPLSNIFSDETLRPTAQELLDHPYLSNIDPLDSGFFDFKQFSDTAEETFRERIRLLQLEAEADSDESDVSEDGI